MEPANSNCLVVLGCSATKFNVKGEIPAVHLYDGPMYRVLRSHLRTFRWPDKLSIGVLSAKYGLIGSLAAISTYNRRMTADRAAQMSADVTKTLGKFSSTHKQIHLILGKDYREAIDTRALQPPVTVHFADGPIGMKLQQFSNLLSAHSHERRSLNTPETANRPLYFLPDWDDFLDVDFDFSNDRFSAKSRKHRSEVHVVQLFRPQRLCDGVLVSLAQHLGTKGLLRRVPLADPDLLRPKSVRQFFGLAPSQMAFGDCGAFSYVNEDRPAISIEQAVALYELYEFDMGASVDHIPVEELLTEKGKRTLSNDERRRRVRITKANADAFLSAWRAKGCSFVPVGVIQGLTPQDYARQINEYTEMGYKHLALGGLVPRTDIEIEEIVKAVSSVTMSMRTAPWIHLLGIFRPKLQTLFRSASINSFDSASYFRKAWLRNDQNYFGVDGQWYGAIRVPPTSDARTLLRLKESGVGERAIRRRESQALAALRAYDRGELGLDECLDAVLRYDILLSRGNLSDASLRMQYEKTLAARPWRRCSCTVCSRIGIDVLIFRGCNRNKRRGAHNTLRLYEQVKGTSRNKAAHVVG